MSSGRTFEQRLGAHEQFVASYHHDFLAKEPGSIFSVPIRLAVSKAARQQQQRPRDDSSEKKRRQMKTLFSQYGAKDDDDKSAAVSDLLADFVSAVVNHQFDKAWYDRMLQGLRDSVIIPGMQQEAERSNKEQNQEQRVEYFVQTAFCELLLVATLSHGMATLFRGLGRDMPVLPAEAPSTTTATATLLV